MPSKQRKTPYACYIGDVYYPNAESLRKELGHVLDQYIKLGRTMDVPLSDEHASMFAELVRMRNPKCIPDGCSITGVFRSLYKGQTGRHLKFTYSNGTEKIIRWSKLCGGRPTDRQCVFQAMRENVAMQRLKAIQDYFRGGLNAGWCPHTGRSISLSGDYCDDRAVAHHTVRSFSELASAWLKEAGLSFDDVPLEDMPGGGCQIASGPIRDSWQAFHAEHARFEIVSERWHRHHHAAEQAGKDSDGQTIEEGATASRCVVDSDEASTDSAVDRLGLPGLRRREEAEEGAAPSRTRPRDQLQRPDGLEDVRRGDVGVRSA